jgi:hypothetical protein
MEGLILIGLAGVGYMVNKNTSSQSSNNRIESNIQPSSFQNSNSSIYDLNNVGDAQKYEAQLVKDNFKKSLDPSSTLINHHLAKEKHVDVSKKKIIEGMDGSYLTESQFLTNDQGVQMAPFFSGEGPAAVNFDDPRTLRAHQGGFKNEFQFPKREVNINLPPQMNVGNVHGMKDTGDAMDPSRYIAGMYKTDERPFEHERVPHIDQNSEINRDIGEIFAQRNSIDNTRALSNQKVSFGSRVIAGKGIDERGKEGQVFKHKPEKDYQQNADQWLVTGGAIDAPLIRPAEILPETNRQYLNRQELGPAGSSVNMSEEKRPMFKKSDKQQLASDTVRNAYGTEIFIDTDHQQSSYKVYPNEREVTQERTYEGNTISVVPGETRQLQDSIKRTLKETTISPKNPSGFTQTVTTFPEERLQDKPKTGKKETTLFEYTGGARGSTLQEMAQDQYFRADLNPNKEEIARGRAPTFESVKLANGMDTLNVDIQKIEDDYFNHRINGVTNVFQKIPTEDTCKFTRDKDTLDNDTISNRIEGDLLDPFKHNPYTHSLHSFAY